MDEFLMRFPMIGQDIFKCLDNKNLVKCKEISEICYNFLNNDIHFWKRRILKHTCNETDFQKDWKLVTRKVPVEFLKQLAFAVEKFFTTHPETLKYHCSPLHIRKYKT